MDPSVHGPMIEENCLLDMFSTPTTNLTLIHIASVVLIMPVAFLGQQAIASVQASLTVSIQAIA